MNETLKKLIAEKLDRMDFKPLLEHGISLSRLSMPQKEMVHTVLTEVIKELVPSFKGGILLVFQVLIQVLVSHCSNGTDK